MTNSELWQQLPPDIQAALQNPRLINDELAERSLSEFIKQAWHVLEPGQAYSHGWHIDAMCEHLEAVTSGEITRLLINVPPGTMKSLTANVLWPAWEWIKHPNHRFVCASHEQGLAIRDNVKTRRLITSEWYQERWPMGLAKDQNAKLYFENDSLGFRQACAVESMTGRRGDRVIWDDPHTIEGALSPAKSATTLRVFDETLPTRLNNPKSSAIVVIMQRIGEEDVSGHILARDLGYEHLMLPMEFEVERRCYTSIGFKDPRTEDGELLFPDRFPKEVVERDKKVMGSYATAGQFQQRPAPRGGGMFKDEWWMYYDTLPQMKRSFVIADTAMKAKEQHDYSVFMHWGEGVNGNAYLIDVQRGKWEAPELEQAFVAFYNKCKHNSSLKLQKALIEDKASGTGLIQSIKRKYKIPISGIQRNREDKVQRAMGVIPFIESGYVFLPKDAHFISDFLNEHRLFPNGKNDDQIDTTSDGLDEIFNKKRDFRARVI